MTKVFLDANIYDKLRDDAEARSHLADGVSRGLVVVVATPVVANEMSESPFRGFPAFFPVRIEPEAVVVLGHARLGMARLGSGKIFKAHRGSSKKTKDAIIADSADKLADLFVSEDSRCRNRLGQFSQRCRPMPYFGFRAWLLSQTW